MNTSTDIHLKPEDDVWYRLPDASHGGLYAVLKFGEPGEVSVFAGEDDLRRLAAVCISAADDLHDARTYPTEVPA